MMTYTIDDMRAAFEAGSDWMALCIGLTNGTVSKEVWAEGYDFEAFIAKITSGELMVVKTQAYETIPGKQCNRCGAVWPVELAPKVGELCRCGAKIIK